MPAKVRPGKGPRAPHGPTGSKPAQGPHKESPTTCADEGSDVAGRREPGAETAAACNCALSAIG
eukprot:6333326-Alexandrium_andersonii.AAC.1